MGISFSPIRRSRSRLDPKIFAFRILIKTDLNIFRPVYESTDGNEPKCLFYHNLQTWVGTIGYCVSTLQATSQQW
jgi:hypothetical protein